MLFSALDFAERLATEMGGEVGFGREVRDILAEVTDDVSLPKAVRKRLQIEHAQTTSE